VFSKSDGNLAESGAVACSSSARRDPRRRRGGRRGRTDARRRRRRRRGRLARGLELSGHDGARGSRGGAERARAIGVAIQSAEPTMVPKTTVTVDDEGLAKKVVRLVESLEDSTTCRTSTRTSTSPSACSRRSPAKSGNRRLRGSTSPRASPRASRGVGSRRWLKPVTAAFAALRLRGPRRGLRRGVGSRRWLKPVTAAFGGLYVSAASRGLRPGRRLAETYFATIDQVRRVCARAVRQLQDQLVVVPDSGPRTVRRRSVRASARTEGRERLAALDERIVALRRRGSRS